MADLLEIVAVPSGVYPSWGLQHPAPGDPSGVEVRICFRFYSDQAGLPAWLSDWPRVLAKLNVRPVMADVGASSMLSTTPDSALWLEAITKRTDWGSSAGSVAPKGAAESYSVAATVTDLSSIRISELQQSSRAPKWLRGTYPPQSSNGALKSAFDFHTSKANASALMMAAAPGRAVAELSLLTSRHPHFAACLGLLVVFRLPATLSALLAASGGYGKVSAAYDNVDELKNVKIEVPEVEYSLSKIGGKYYFVPYPRAGAGYDATHPGVQNMESYFLESLDYLASGGRMWTQQGGQSCRAPDPGLECDRDFGLALVESGAATTFATRASAYAAGNALTAADLLQGYRADVKRDHGEFSSLCRRAINYDLMPADEREYHEEGLIERALLSDTPGRRAIHEELVRWTGWSLVAPLPGSAIADEGDQPKGAVPLVKHGVAPQRNSVTPLREQSEYSMGLRCVFLGGYSVFSEDASAMRLVVEQPTRLSTGTFRLTRSENLPTPRIVRGKMSRDLTRESCDEVLVVGELGGAIRWVLPPTASVERCLVSGAFDRFSGDRNAAYALIKDREREQPPRECDIDPDVDYLPDPDVAAVLVKIRLRERGPAELTAPPARKNYGRCILSRQPDGITFYRVPFYSRPEAWPQACPFRLVVKPVGSGPSWTRPFASGSTLDAGTRITIGLAPGDAVEVTLQSLWRDAPEARRFRTTTGRLLESTYNEVVDGLTVEQLAEIDQLSSGERRLQAEHATWKPNEVPQFVNPRLVRTAGETNVTLEDLILLDGATTGSLEAEATWVDLEPDAAHPPLFKEVRRSAKSLRIPVNPPSLAPQSCEPGATSPPAYRLVLSIPLPDTRARELRVRLRAFSRRERELRAINEKRKFHVESEEITLTAPCSERPKTATVRYGWPTRTAQETRERSNFDAHTSGNVLRVYVDGPFATGPREMLGIVCLPDEQERFGLPAGREDEARARRLELGQFVSQWGAEVLLQTANIPLGPFARHFTRACTRLDGLGRLERLDGSLQGKSVVGPVATIAGHELAFDEVENAWYADIEVSCDQTYLPWVRPALVRLQPDAIDGCHISPVVLGPFWQVGPSRSVAVVRASSDPTLYRISVSGATARPIESVLPPSGLRSQLLGPYLIAQFQQVDADTGTWVGVGKRVVFERIDDRAPSAGWRGAVRLSSSIRGRLELREVLACGDPNDPDGPDLEWEETHKVDLWHVPVPL